MVRPHVPPAGTDLALPLYDPLTRLLGADRDRAELIAQASLRPGMRALDVGCGTGSLVLDLLRSHPGVEVVGLDPNAPALRRAERKLARAGARAELVQGYGDALPMGDGSFDRVFSSYMLHHVPPEARGATLREVRRVLRPGGALHLVDFDHGEALASLQAAGFDARVVRTRRTWFGPATWYHADRG